MNWEAISAVSELVGVTAVMITFIYLAVQIRQNPAALNAEDVVQFNFLLRCYANQWWKLFKLHERGSLPVAEWGIFAREAAQFLNQPGCKPFRAQNALFADLYTELDMHGGAEISDFGFADQTPVD